MTTQELEFESYNDKFLLNFFTARQAEILSNLMNLIENDLPKSNNYIDDNGSCSIELTLLDFSRKHPHIFFTCFVNFEPNTPPPVILIDVMVSIIAASKTHGVDFKNIKIDDMQLWMSLVDHRVIHIN
jgi:hypothetical protein